MRWKSRNELEIREMRWRVDQGHVILIHGISSVLRVEKGPCKLDSWDLKCVKS